MRNVLAKIDKSRAFTVYSVGFCKFKMPREGMHLKRLLGLMISGTPSIMMHKLMPKIWYSTCVYGTLTNTDPFELAIIQAGVFINKAIWGAGTPTVSIVAGTSQLPAAMVPTSISIAAIASGVPGYPDKWIIKLAAKAGPGCGSGAFLPYAPLDIVFVRSRSPVRLILLQTHRPVSRFALLQHPIRPKFSNTLLICRRVQAPGSPQPPPTP